MNSLTRSLVILLTFVLLTACGGGGGGGGSTSNTTSSSIPIGFAKTDAVFAQHEGILLETDECHIISSTMLNGEFIYPKSLDNINYAFEVPASNDPGNYVLEVTMFNHCETESNSSWFTVQLPFDLQQGITVLDPVTFLDAKITETIALIDELLLTVTDQQTIDMLTQQRVIMIEERAKIITQDISITTNTANIWLNNDPLSSLPTSAVLDPNRGALIIGSSILFVGGFATGNPVIMGAGLAGLIYNYYKFITDYGLASEYIYGNIALVLSGEGDVNYYDTLYDGVPSGITLDSVSALSFTPNFTNSIGIIKTGAMAEDDKSLINDVKSSILKIISFLPSNIVDAVNAMSSDNLSEPVTDLSAYSIVSLSDSRLSAQITNSTEILAGANEIGIMVSKVSGAVITDKRLPFTLTLSDGQGNQLQLNAAYYPDIPPPIANDMDFWYDFSGAGLIYGTVDTYDIPSHITTLNSSYSGGYILNTQFAETVEIIRAPQYLLPLDGVNYLNVWTGNGIENSEVSLNIDTSGFLEHLPDGGEMTDYLQYRVINSSGVSATKTIHFSSKYMASNQRMTIDLTNSLPDTGLAYSARETLTVPLYKTPGHINSRYSVSLEITPQYEVWSIVYDPFATGNYIVRLVVKDTVTEATLSNMVTPNLILADLNNAGGWIDVISDGAGGAWENSALRNGPEVLIGNPSWMIVTKDELTGPLTYVISQAMYTTCKFPIEFDEFYGFTSRAMYQQFCVN